MKWFFQTITINISVLFLFLSYNPVLSFAEDTPASAIFNPKELPEDVKKIFEKGLNAAADENWEVAAEYFDSIIDDYLFYPPLMFNAGLTKGNTGEELEGIAWLNAYLRADLETPNREAILTEISRLKLAMDDKVLSIFKMLEKKLSTVPVNNYGNLIYRDSACEYLTDAMAEAGHIEEARNIRLSGIDGSPRDTTIAYFKARHANMLARAGDIKGAEDILGNEEVALIDKAAFAWKEVARTYLELGKHSEAWKALKNVKGSDYKILELIVQKDLDTGDLIPVKAALKELTDDWTKMGLTRKLMTGYVNHGEIDKAIQILEVFGENDHKINVTFFLAEELWKQGYIDQAKEFMGALIDKGDSRPKALALAGKFKEAKKISLVMKQNGFYPIGHAKTHALIARLQMYEGSLSSAKKTMKDVLKRKDGIGQQSEVHYAVAQILVERGKIKDAIKVSNSIKIKKDEDYAYLADSHRTMILYDVAMYKLKNGDIDSAKEYIHKIHGKESEWAGDSTALEFAEQYKAQGDITKAITIYQYAFKKSLKDGGYTGVSNFEKSLRDQFQIGIDSGELNAEVVDWVVFAKFVKHFGNIQKELARAAKAPSGESDEVWRVISRSSKAAVEIKRFLLKAGTMEQGYHTKPLSSLVTEVYKDDRAF